MLVSILIGLVSYFNYPSRYSCGRLNTECNSSPQPFLEVDSNPLSDIFLSPNVSSWKIIPRFNNQVASSVTGELKSEQFASIFQQCAPYIAMHRGSKIVLHIPSHVIADREVFDAVMDDICILHLLGVQLVLVASVRDQLDNCRASLLPDSTHYHGGVRITDELSLRCLKETSGSARSAIESSLARGFRGRPGQSGINVVSGNFFYSAKPVGVRDGVDFKYTGEVRRIEVDNFSKRLEQGDVVLLTSLGYSSSGEVFHVPSESLAAECAAQLGASKIIYLTDGQVIVDDNQEDNSDGVNTNNNTATTSATSTPVQSLRIAQATALLDRFGVSSSKFSDQVEIDHLESITGKKIHDNNDITPSGTGTEEYRILSQSGADANERAAGAVIRLIARSVKSLLGGVRRAHLVPPMRGSLLKELYTRDGAGILISKDVYEGIRRATASDLRVIEEIISPLVVEGILVPRSRDGTIVALGMLKRFGPLHAEICCLAVHPAYRRSGRGETLLAYLERKALALGITNWFEERGYELSEPSLLPETRMYNSARGSKVYIKKLGTQRDVDVQEDLWNV
eukprot:gene1080-2110_t